MNAVEPGTPNWSAYLELKFQPGEVKTSLVPVQRYGPLSVQRPFYPERDVCHTYLLHPPGGVVGGDRLDLELHNEAASHSLVTTPGATKFYLSAGQTANVSQSMRVDKSATLEFLPQENIYFPGARVNQHTRLQLAGDATVLYWEKHCFGRPVNDETFDSGFVRSRLDIRSGDQWLLSETQRIDYQEIQRASGLRNHPVMGCFVIAGGTCDGELLQACRDIDCVDGSCGITLLEEGLLIIRYMGNSTLELNVYFTRLWELIRPRAIQRDACHPRIWNT